MHAAHHHIEAKERRGITQIEMAKRIGVGHQTYVEYLRGKNAPLGMKALLNLLSLMDESSVLGLVRDWRAK